MGLQGHWFGIKLHKIHQRLFPASNHMHTPGGPNVHQNSITSFGKEVGRLPGVSSWNIEGAPFRADHSFAHALFIII